MDGGLNQPRPKGVAKEEALVRGPELHKANPPEAPQPNALAVQRLRHGRPFAALPALTAELHRVKALEPGQSWRCRREDSRQLLALTTKALKVTFRQVQLAVVMSSGPLNMGVSKTSNTATKMNRVHHRKMACL